MAFRFSIRTALVALTIGAGFSLILAQAAQGAHWALAVAIGVASLPFVFLPYAAVYWVIRAVSAMLDQRPNQQGAKPGGAKP